MVMQGIEIPAGYETDLLSMRTWHRLLLTDYEQATEASVLHDYLYDYPSLRTRAEVDGLFLREMTERGVGRYSRTIMWLGVRLGGWRKWRILGRAA